jgi:hypothetical protein
MKTFYLYIMIVLLNGTRCSLENNPDPFDDLNSIDSQLP